MKRYIEIRAAEGGDDSKLLVADLAKAYTKLILRKGWLLVSAINRAGETVLEVKGSDLSFLENEAGGHQFQRVPPTERKGRVHTSLVTVAVTSEIKLNFKLTEADVRVEWYSGTGAGGQHRNKHQNSCRLTHKATGIIATSQQRSRENSYEEAWKQLESRILAIEKSKIAEISASSRVIQIGIGNRGEKIRTYAMQHGIAKDHRSNSTASVDLVLKGGHFDKLWV
jgi:peptide chain release factor 1